MDECLTLSLAYSQNELAYSQSPSVFFVVITLKKEEDALRIYVLQLIVLGRIIIQPDIASYY